jgi:hypothetical protein
MVISNPFCCPRKSYLSFSKKGLSHMWTNKPKEVINCRYCPEKLGYPAFVWSVQTGEPQVVWPVSSLNSSFSSSFFFVCRQSACLGVETTSGTRLSENEKRLLNHLKVAGRTTIISYSRWHIAKKQKRKTFHTQEQYATGSARYFNALKTYRYSAKFLQKLISTTIITSELSNITRKCVLKKQ